MITEAKPVVTWLVVQLQLESRKNMVDPPLNP